MKYEVQINGIQVANSFDDSEFDILLKPIVETVFGFMEYEYESVENLQTVEEIMEKYVSQYYV